MNHRSDFFISDRFSHEVTLQVSSRFFDEAIRSCFSLVFPLQKLCKNSLQRYFKSYGFIFFHYKWRLAVQEYNQI